MSAFFRDFWMTSGDHIAPADTFESFESRCKGGFDARQFTDQLTAPAAQTTRPRKVSQYGGVAFAVLGVGFALASHMGWSELAAAIPKGSQQL